MRYVLILFFVIFSLNTSGYAYEVVDDIAEKTAIDQIERGLAPEIRRMLSEFDITTGDGLEAVLKNLKEFILSALNQQLAGIWKPSMHTLMITIAAALLISTVPGEKNLYPITLSGGCAIIYLMITGAQSLFHDCLMAMQQIYDFSTLLLPCLAAISAFSGTSVSAGVKYTAAALFMNILLNFCNTFLLPLICVYLVCVIGQVLFEQKLLESLAIFVKWCCKTAMTGSVILFTSYLSIAGLIASSGDIFSIRITKTLLSSGLPVVGKIISDSASTLVAGASVLKNCVGIYGLLAVISIITIPFISMTVRYFLFKIVGEVSRLFPYQRFSPLIQGIAGAFGMMMGVLGTGFLTIFLTLISFMQVMTG